MLAPDSFMLPVPFRTSDRTCVPVSARTLESVLPSIVLPDSNELAALNTGEPRHATAAPSTVTMPPVNV